MLPQPRSDQGQRIAERRPMFDVPGAGPHRHPLECPKPMGDERHEREQSHQHRRGSGNGSVRPLPLGLDAEMRADFLEGDFHLPTLNEPCEDGLRCRLRVGIEKRLRFEATPGIVHQHPADRHRRFAAVIPHRRTTKPRAAAQSRPLAN